MFDCSGKISRPSDVQRQIVQKKKQSFIDSPRVDRFGEQMIEYLATVGWLMRQADIQLVKNPLDSR